MYNLLEKIKLHATCQSDKNTEAKNSKLKLFKLPKNCFEISEIKFTLLPRQQ